MVAKKKRSKLNQSKPIWLVLIGLIALSLLVATLLKGSDIALLNPKGVIASEERKLMFYTVFILLDIGIPTLLLFYLVAWRYRDTNEKAHHTPNTSGSKSLVFLIWALPFVIMLLLAAVMWPAAHRLAPKQAIISDAKPMTIEVIAMRWKWLFIYPEQDIATVNFVQIPTNTPVQFVITADETPMSSFWIPHLGGQLYAMTGHENQLNLMAETPGDYEGRSAEINGAGFAGMTFTTRASSREEFNQWVQSIRLSTQTLGTNEYKELLVPSENNSSVFYAKADPNLFNNLILKYNGSHGGHAETEHE
jgi:cytochrome o ubiquinol oxidase subunit 2